MPTSQFSLMTPNFGLKRGKIGTRVGDGTYSGVIQVPSIQMLGITQKVQTGELEGNDSITDSHGRAIKATARFRFGSVSLEVLKVITGQTYASAGTTPSRTQKMYFRSVGFPYFGIAGLSESTNGTGGLIVFAPMCKVVADFAVVESEYGKYTIPDLTVDVLADDFYQNGATSMVWTITLTNATGGTFTLTFAGATTSALAYNATAATVQTALQALATVGSGNLTVSGSAGGPYTVTAASDLAETALAGLLTASGASLTGTSPTIAVTETTPGVNPTPTQFAILKYESSPTVLSLPPA